MKCTKTKEEYETTAMLLGRVYDPSAHSFFKPDWPKDPEISLDLDADTLEPLSHYEVTSRHLEGVRSNKKRVDKMAGENGYDETY